MDNLLYILRAPSKSLGGHVEDGVFETGGLLNI